MTDKKTIASYAENAGKATKAISAEVAARCTGNAETATAFKDAHEIIFSGDAEATAKFDGAADLIIDVKNTIIFLKRTQQKRSWKNTR